MWNPGMTFPGNLASSREIARLRVVVNLHAVPVVFFMYSIC